ncbi:PAS domain-containing protein [Microvirga antarctica]|uniref:PAS domain-containing protein n=1 Tax=Microvirga antarctica TaxID=2819233 RepID=UPI001B307792|nr:PAS domain-containing protein [Microvirga antarctica]
MGVEHARDDERVAILEQKLRAAEALLQRSNAKLRVALDMAKLGIYERDLISDEISMTAPTREALGLSAGEPLTVDRLRRLFDPKDAARIEQAIAYALRTKTDFNIEHRVVRPDGGTGHVLQRGCALYNGDIPFRLVAVTQDVTDRERVRREGTVAQRRQTFLLNLNDRLRDLEDPNAIMEATVQSLGQFLEVDFAGYGEVDEELGVNVMAREWSRWVVSTEGRQFRLNEFLPDMVVQLKAGKTLCVDDVDTDPRVRDPAIQAIYRTINARTAIGVPLLKNQRLVAMLYLNAARPRHWSTDEIALVEDVAERTWTAVQKARAESSLRETDALFRVIAESLPALVWIVKPNLELTYTNERWVSYSGFPKEQALGHSWMTTIYPPDMERMRDELVPVQENESAYETEARYRSRSGEYRWHLIRAAPRHSQTGEFLGWCGTSVDIHDLKETSTALQESEQRLALAQQAVGIGVFDWDVPSGKVTWTVEQERLFGLDPNTFTQDFEGWESRVVPADLDQTKAMLEAAMARRDSDITFSHRIMLPDGTIRFIEVNARFFYDPDGNPLRMVGVNIDVTRYKQAEQRQHLLIRELHHRVKNTLATVQAIVGSTARSTSSIDEFYQSFVGRIVSLARTHNLLTEDYWQKASLGDLIRTELGPYDDAGRKRVFISGPPVELPSEAAVPVGMAIHELTTNAAKHGALSSFGGNVDVRWRVDDKESGPVLHFDWTERDGPTVSAPSRQGFGSRLLNRVLTTQLGADVKIDFREDGLRFAMTMPIPAVPPLPDTSQ